MDLFTAVIVYFLIWWTLLFCVLPFGNQPDQDQIKGQSGSAPKNPRILKKFLATSVISAIALLVIYLVIDSGVISFHDMAQKLEIEDQKEKDQK